MTGERPIGEDDLQAFIDGRLEPARLERVKVYLEAHPELSEQVRRDGELRDALRARLSFKAQEPIPARLRVANLIAARRRTPLLRPAAMAAMAWLVLGAAIGAMGGAWWAFSRSVHGIDLAGNAIAAHRIYVSERLHPVEVPAEQEAHLVQWLSRRVGKPLSAPDLNGQGYRLIGGRLLPAGSGAAALFMYENQAGQRLTLYARSGDAKTHTAFRFEAQDGVSAFSWIDNGLSYVIAANTDRTILLPIAEAVYRQLEATSSTVRDRL